MKLKFDMYTADCQAATNAYNEISDVCDEDLTLSKQNHWNTEKVYYNIYGNVNNVENIQVVTVALADFVDDSSDLT